jgi:hypothetical protein
MARGPEPPSVVVVGGLGPVGARVIPIGPAGVGFRRKMTRNHPHLRLRETPSEMVSARERVEVRLVAVVSEVRAGATSRWDSEIQRMCKIQRMCTGTARVHTSRRSIFCPRLPFVNLNGTE